MSRRRKARLSFMDVAALPVGQAIHNGRVVVDPDRNGRPQVNEYRSPKPERETFESFMQARVQRQEAESQRAQLDDAAERIRQTKREYLFKTQSPDLRQRTVEVPDKIEGTVEEIRKKIFGALETCKHNLEAEGVTLTHSGVEKIRAVSRVNLDRDWRRPETWRAAYDVISELDAFDSDDRIFEQAQPLEPLSAAEMTSEQRRILLDKTMSEIDTAYASPEQQQELRRSVRDAVQWNEFRPVWQGFEKFMFEQYGLTCDTQLRNDIEAIFHRLGLNLLRHEDYNVVRREAVTRGILPERCLSVREVIERSYKRNELTDREYLQRLRQYESILDKPRAVAGI